MRMTDRFELPVTAASAEAVADYVAAVDLLLSANPGADARLERALAADPDFALAQIARARLLQLQARIGEARAAAERATALAVRASTREQRHVEAIARAIAGDAPGALALVREHAAEYPRDALPLSLALGVFGLLGFSGRRDHHEAQLALLEGLAPHWPEDWWFLGISRVGRDRDRCRGDGHAARRTLARTQPAQRAWRASAGARLFRSGRCRGRRRALSRIGCRATSAPAICTAICRGIWHCSNWPAATATRAMAVYRDAIRPAVALSVPMLSLADSASFLWRWQIYGTRPALADEWKEVAVHARRHFPRASLAFADLHAALAEAATGDDAAVESRIAGLNQLAAEGKLPSGEVAPALCAAAAALARADPAKAAAVLEAALADLPRVGGSHAQREVFEDALIIADLKSGRPENAARLLRARLARRPSTRDEDWLRRCSRP